MSPSIDPVLLQRAQPQGWSLMDLSQLFRLSGFVKASWLQSCHMPRLGQGLCSCKGPGTLSPQTSGLTDSRFYREPNKLCSVPMVSNKVCAETERALGISYTGCSSEASWNKDSAPVCATSCDLACFLTSVHSDSKHLHLSSSVSLTLLLTLLIVLSWLHHESIDSDSGAAELKTRILQML